MPAPTFVQEAETTWNDSTTPRTTASFNVLASDVLATVAVCENELRDISVSGGTLTWTERQEVNIANYCRAHASTATVDVDKSMAASIAAAGGTSQFFGGNALTFRGSDGVGASVKANATGTPSVGITTTQANSAVVVVIGDWNAADGATRAWLTAGVAATEVSYFRDATKYTVYAAYYSDVGAAGAKTVGLSAPAGQQYAIVAVEIKGSAAAATPPILVMPPMRATRR